MEAILKLYFKRILNKVDGINGVGCVEDLCKAATFYLEDIVQVFAILNDEPYGFNTNSVIAIANDVYKELV